MRELQSNVRQLECTCVGLEEKASAAERRSEDKVCTGTFFYTYKENGSTIDRALFSTPRAVCIWIFSSSFFNSSPSSGRVRGLR